MRAPAPKHAPKSAPTHDPAGEAVRGARLGLVAALLVASPVLTGIGYSLAAALGLTGVGARGLTGARVVGALTDPLTWRALGWSLRTALAATLLATAGAVLVAVVFRGSARLDRAARALALVPLPLPPIVAATSALLVLGQSGVLARLAHTAGWIAAPADFPPLVQDRAGASVILALAWKELPFLALVAGTLLGGAARDAEEAARTLGAGPWATFRRVTWPSLWRGLLPAVVAVFAFVVGSWEVAALLGPSDPPALATLLVERGEDLDLQRRGETHVLALLALVVAGGAVCAHEIARARSDRLRDPRPGDA